MIAVTNHASSVIARLRAAAQAGVLAAAQVAADRATERVNVRYPPASKPGESPRRRASGRADPLVVLDVPGEEPGADVHVKRNATILGWYEKNGRPWIAPAVQETFNQQAAAYESAASESLR